MPDSDRAGDMLSANAGATAMLNNAFSRGAEAWLNARANLIANVGSLTDDWLRRRREAFGATLDTMRRIGECNDLGDAARLQRDWLADSAARAVSELAALGTGVITLARCTTAKFDGSAPAAEATGQAGEVMLSAAGRKPASRRTES
jgi:hypothetical protein